MSRIRSKNTIPELKVRSALRKAGYKCSQHNKNLPGKPDLVLHRRKTVVFIHGCFWHQHKRCRKANIPKSNKGYWVPKLKRNTNRDKIHVRKLKKLGWCIIIIWECQIKNEADIVRLFRKQLRKRRRQKDEKKPHYR